MNKPHETGTALLEKGSLALTRLYLICGLLLLASLLFNHFQLIQFELPLDYNEPFTPTVTATIASGGNPFSFENQPARTSLYPVLLNLVAAPLTPFFGNTLEFHRALAALFVCLSCITLFWVTYRESRSSTDSFLAAVMIYASFLYYSTPIAGPNSIGLFLFVASISIPYQFNFSRGSLIAALFIGLLAFYAKQYYVASLGYIALYMFLAVSKKKAILFGLWSLGLFLASLTAVNYVAPYYLDGTLFAIAYSAGAVSSTETMLRQMTAYGLILLPVLLILAIAMLVKFWSVLRHDSARLTHAETGQVLKGLNFRDFDAPLASAKVSYIWCCLTCSLIIIVFSLGRNPGNFLSYHFQLISPFLLVAVFVLVARAKKLKWLFQLLAIAGCWNAYSMQSHDFTVSDEENWHHVTKLVAESDSVYVANILLAEVLKNDLEIHQNGATPYFYFAKDKPDFFKRHSTRESVPVIWQNYVDSIHRKVRQQEFDLVIIDSWTRLPDMPSDSGSQVSGHELLKKYYRIRERRVVSLANRPGGVKYGMRVWEPIPNLQDQ